MENNPSAFYQNSQIRDIPASLTLQKLPLAKHTRKQRKCGIGEEKAFTCDQCGKKYLSSPALYTHRKLKHPELHKKSQLDSDLVRKRGRPKKVVPMDTTPTDNKYFEDPERKGQTSDIVNCIEDVLVSLTKPMDYPLLDCIKAELSEAKAEKAIKVCDDVLAEYLVSTSKLVKKEFYLVIVKFAVLYRDCFNQADAVRSKRDTAEKLPEISNEFVTQFVKDRIPNQTTIELTQNLCNWLFINKYTCLKLSLVA